MTQDLRRFIIVLSFLIVGIVIYFPSFHGSFQLDDYYSIVTNYVVTNIHNVSAIWQQDPSRFFTHLSFAVNYYFSGLQPFSYRIVNFLIHFIATLIVFLLVKATLDKRKDEDAFSDYEIRILSYLAALIFLVHPIQTSTVSYVAQRATLLATLSYLTALFGFIYYRQTNQKQFYFASIAVFILGLFTKPIIITLPVAIIVYDRFFLTTSVRVSKKEITEYLLYFLIALSVPILLLLWKYQTLALGNILDITKETDVISRSTYLLTQINVLVTYLQLLILPIHQNLDYDYPLNVSFWNIQTILSFTILVSLAAWGVKSFQTNRLRSFGIFWFFITLSIESSIFPIKDVIFEHRLYLPMFGFVLFLLSFFKRLFVNPKIGRILSIVLIAQLALLSYERNVLWGDRIGFLEDVVAKSPNKARPYNNLAFAYYEEKNYTKALEGFNKAIALDPIYAVAYCNRGRFYQEFKQNDLALADFEKALSIKQDYVEVYNNIGVLYMGADVDKAKENFNQAIFFDPYFVPAYVNRGIIAQQNKDFDTALKDYDHAIALRPDFIDAYNNRGIVYSLQKEYRKAISDFDRVLQLNPQHDIARRNRWIAEQMEQGKIKNP